MPRLTNTFQCKYISGYHMDWNVVCLALFQLIFHSLKATRHYSPVDAQHLVVRSIHHSSSNYLLFWGCIISSPSSNRTADQPQISVIHWCRIPRKFRSLFGITMTAQHIVPGMFSAVLVNAIVDEPSAGSRKGSLN